MNYGLNQSPEANTPPPPPRQSRTDAHIHTFFYFLKCLPWLVLERNCPATFFFSLCPTRHCIVLPAVENTNIPKTCRSRIHFQSEQVNQLSREQPHFRENRDSELGGRGRECWGKGGLGGVGGRRIGASPSEALSSIPPRSSDGGVWMSP